MTTKDYVILAGVVRRMRRKYYKQYPEAEVVEAVVDEMVWALKRDNEKFDEGKFFKEVKVEKR